MALGISERLEVDQLQRRLAALEEERRLMLRCLRELLGGKRPARLRHDVIALLGEEAEADLESISGQPAAV